MKQLIFIFLYLTLAHAEHNYTNALINEDSPYLQQHAHNPVNWYPWGEEAFEKAKRENKLIFVSIGYSTCHWCHVMEEESFTNRKVAKLLNDDFVSIKVDREAFPQLDQKYQKFYMAVHGERGGWPLSIFMSPDAEVFHLATYIPTEEAYGSIGLMKMLPSFVERQKHPQQFKQELASYRNIFLQGNKKEGLYQSNLRIIDKVVENIVKTFDVENGGFVKHPKFPEASKLALLLDIYALSGNKQAFDMAEFTLKKMAEGGIYDQVGGGFFRYTTDTQWQIPHFEKMLYTNAELISVYVKLYEITGDRLYKKVVDETIAQMEKNYRQDNLYLSASDADSDGEEGGYFIYAYVEMKKALKAKGWKPKEIEDALAYMGIEEDGNIDGDFSHTHITSQQIPVRLEALKTYLREVSAGRTFPFVDKKINTAWNAMMVKALFEASKLDKKYLPLAEKSLNALLTLMYRDTVLYHQVLLKKSPRQKALLEDYAFLIDALLEGYARTYRQAYLSLAQKLSDEAVEKFYKKHRWYLSADGIEAYADFDDRYYTSALSLMLENLVRLSTLIEVVSYKKLAQETINASAAVLEENPENAAKLVHTFLRLKKGDIVIHAKKQKLLMVHSALDSIRYPFILSAVQESDEYLACKSTMCFAYDKNMTKLIDQINKAVK